MIGYVTLGTNDLARAARFYDALLGAMGAKRAMESEKLVAWSTDPATSSMVCVIKPHDGKAATVGNGMMVALTADKPETVDRLYAKAIELGAKDEGKPGDRGGGFYAGYFRDLDGNKLNFYCLK